MIDSRKRHFLLLSVVSALILSLGWPRFGFPGLLFFGFVPLFFIEETILNNREKFGRFHLFRWVWITFFIWNGLTTWWIWNSTIFGAVMAIILNSFFQALVFVAYHFVRRNLRPMAGGPLLLIAFWIGFEYLHLDWDLSWPWLNLGNGFAAYPRWIQWYEYTGCFGGSLWVLMANAFAFLAIKAAIRRQKRLVLQNSSAFTVLLVVPLVVSGILWHQYTEQGKPIDVVVVQPNNDPWSEQYGLPTQNVVDRLLALSETKTDSAVKYVVFPESAIYDDIWLDNIGSTESIRKIAGFVKAHPQVAVIAGVSSYQYYGKVKQTETARRFSHGDEFYDAYNTAICIDTSLKFEYTHKSKLVPGPERLPFPSVTFALQKIAFDLGGTVGSLGTMPNRVVLGHSTATPVCVPICYESIYGDFLTGFIRNGAQLIFVITNDGWWGHTAGHRQHFTFSQLRAIETRRDVARAANTGISGFIDQRGEIIAESTYWQEAVMRHTLHANTFLTFYVKYGDYIGRLAAFTSLLFLLLAISMVLRHKKNYPLKQHPTLQVQAEVFGAAWHNIFTTEESTCIGGLTNGGVTVCSGRPSHCESPLCSGFGKGTVCLGMLPVDCLYKFFQSNS